MFRAPRLRLAALAAAALVGATVALPAVPSAAVGRPRAGSSSQASLQAEIGDASAEEQAAVAGVLAVRARRQKLDARIASLDGQIRSATDRQRAAELRLFVVARHYLQLTAQMQESSVKLLVARIDFQDSIASLYRSGGGGAPAYLELMEQADDIRQVNAGRHYLQDASRAHRSAVAQYVAQRERVAKERDQLKGEKAAAESARADASREAARLSGLRREQDAARAAVKVEESRESAALASIRSRKAEFERQLAAQQAASARVGGVLSGRPSSGSRPGKLLKPASGPISSPFGWRMHPIFHEMRFHSGIDIGAGYGSAVRAAAAGTVVSAGQISGYGNAIVIDHGGGLGTLYGHLSRFSVRAGQRVSAGQTIGAVGNTGNSTGPHLHFEVRVNGKPVDPMGYL